MTVILILLDDVTCVTAERHIFVADYKDCSRLGEIAEVADARSVCCRNGDCEFVGKENFLLFNHTRFVDGVKLLVVCRDEDIDVSAFLNLRL